MTTTTFSTTATTSAKEAFKNAIAVLWNGTCPSFKDYRNGGQWFSLSVRHPETGWAVLAETKTYGELVDHMAKVAGMGILPEGTLISAGRQYDYCEEECSHREQTFLLAQVGRTLRLGEHRS